MLGIKSTTGQSLQTIKITDKIKVDIHVNTNTTWVKGKKVKISLLQAMEAHRVARG
jgi:hypothetical protein